MFSVFAIQGIIKQASMILAYKRTPLHKSMQQSAIPLEHIIIQIPAISYCWENKLGLISFSRITSAP